MWAQLSLDHCMLALRVSLWLAGHKPAPNHVLELPGRCPHVPVCHCCFQTHAGPQLPPEPRLALAAPQPRDGIIHAREVWEMPDGWQGHHVDIPWQPAFPPVCRFTAFSRYVSVRGCGALLHCPLLHVVFMKLLLNRIFYSFFFNLLFFSPERMFWSVITSFLWTLSGLDITDFSPLF